MKTVFSVRADANKVSEWKRYARDADVTVSELVEYALDTFISDNNNLLMVLERKADKLAARILKAKGEC